MMIEEGRLENSRGDREGLLLVKSSRVLISIIEEEEKEKVEGMAARMPHGNANERKRGTKKTKKGRMQVRMGSRKCTVRQTRRRQKAEAPQVSCCRQASCLQALAGCLQLFSPIIERRFTRLEQGH